MSDDAQAARQGNHPYRWAILFGVWLIYAGFGVTISGIAPLVGPITDDLAISHGAMGLTMGAWPFVYIFSAMPCGVAIDRAGPRLGLMVAAVIMAVSCDKLTAGSAFRPVVTGCINSTARWAASQEEPPLPAVSSLPDCR